jgi:hypothetical protein
MAIGVLTPSRNTPRLGVHPVNDDATVLRVYVHEKANQFLKFTL